MSGEHLISKAILLQLGDQSIYIEGLPWCRDMKKVGIDRVIGRVLCSRHNSNLSPLDESAAKLFRCLSQLPQRLANISGREECIVHGFNIERWMLKMMITLLRSGNASQRGQRVISPLNPEWLGVLVGACDLKPHCGLYLERPESGTVEMMKEFTVRLMWIEDLCVGIATSFLGYVFHFYPEQIDGFSDRYLYRPGGLVFRRGSVDKVLTIHYGNQVFGEVPILMV
jgi:hypothetical protein